jgi:hypothetical protein
VKWRERFLWDSDNDVLVSSDAFKNVKVIYRKVSKWHSKRHEPFKAQFVKCFFQLIDGGISFIKHQVWLESLNKFSCVKFKNDPHFQMIYGIWFKICEFSTNLRIGFHVWIQMRAMPFPYSDVRLLWTRLALWRAKIVSTAVREIRVPCSTWSTDLHVTQVLCHNK